MQEQVEAIASILKGAGFPTSIEHNRIRVAFQNRVCGTHEVAIMLEDEIDRHCLDVLVEVI